MQVINSFHKCGTSFIQLYILRVYIEPLPDCLKPKVTTVLNGLSRIAILLCTTLMLQGCFGFSFWFDRLDTLTVWQLDRMFDLTDQQEELVRPVAKELQVWLREEKLPRIEKQLTEVKTLWEQGNHVAALETFEQHAGATTDLFLEKSWPKVSDLLAKLTKENAYAYQAYAESRMEEWFEESASESAKVDDRIENLEEWFGGLNDRQVALVKEHTFLAEDELFLRTSNGRERRQRFLALVLDDNWQEVELAYKDPRTLQSEAYKDWREEQREQWQITLMALFPTLTEEQKEHVGDRLDEWIENVRSVI